VIYQILLIFPLIVLIIFPCINRPLSAGQQLSLVPSVALGFLFSLAYFDRNGASSSAEACVPGSACYSLEMIAMVFCFPAAIVSILLFLYLEFRGRSFKK